MPNTKFILMAFIIAVCALATFAQETRKSKTQLKDETSIRENVKLLETGWNTKSGATYAKPFTEDADHVAINGTHHQGRAVIEARHQQMFDTFFKNSTISLTIKQIRFLEKNVALVHVTGNNKTQQGENLIELNVIISLVMIKQSGVWKIASLHNTKVENQQSR